MLIVDGVFAFRPEIDAHFDHRVWPDVTPETSVRRGIERDKDMPGADAGAIHRDRCLPAERVHLSEADPVGRAGFVIGDSVFAQPRIIRG
ncbi:hypothetical protein [Kibdelosporangium phytohabitans]|uniref:hypothetical protein n=1 Tax=Kibdelosporangium phytohabitans TaxID=860235 RepID=UPI001A016EE8|nr:hypothetical protein [Kibdelosporangium phytohabitans]MBE1468949.1 uridine kinase [Kibdelosporangium phytohabitans]